MEPGFGFEQYVDYALEVPMYFVYRNGTYHNALGMSFKDFMKGKLPVLPGRAQPGGAVREHQQCGRHRCSTCAKAMKL